MAAARACGDTARLGAPTFCGAAAGGSAEGASTARPDWHMHRPLIIVFSFPIVPMHDGCVWRVMSSVQRLPRPPCPRPSPSARDGRLTAGGAAQLDVPHRDTPRFSSQPSNHGQDQMGYPVFSPPQRPRRRVTALAVHGGNAQACGVSPAISNYRHVRVIDAIVTIRVQQLLRLTRKRGHSRPSSTSTVLLVVRLRRGRAGGMPQRSAVSSHTSSR